MVKDFIWGLPAAALLDRTDRDLINFVVIPVERFGFMGLFGEQLNLLND